MPRKGVGVAVAEFVVQILVQSSSRLLELLEYTTIRNTYSFVFVGTWKIRVSRHDMALLKNNNNNNNLF